MRNIITIINNTQNPTEAQDKILKGANFLADAVKQTLGPYGKNFILEKGPKITNDGIGIAKEIALKDEIENLALRLARESLIRTNEDAGDGTTTAAVLMQAILKELVRLLPGKNLAGKMSILKLREKVNSELKEVLEKLKQKSKPVKSREELISIAKVSVEDDNLAELIGGNQWDLGPEGTLIVEEHNEPTDLVEKIHGIRIDNGFGTSLAINDQEKQRLLVKNVKVLMTNYTLQSLAPILNCLNDLVRAGHRDIVLIARAFTEDAIRDCIKNHESGIRIYPINAPYINQVQIFKDLEAVLGGKFINAEESSLDDLTADCAGYAQKVMGYRWNAIFTGKKDEQSETRVALRVEKLEKEYQGEPSKFNKRALKERISQLKGGFGLVKIGALTEQERKYKYDKAEDAINAVKSALSEGTVRGGGIAMKEISEEMPEDSILKKPLLAPYQQIMQNAGENFEIEEWVRNSVKVERVALENACQVALNLATACGAVAQARLPDLETAIKGLK